MDSDDDTATVSVSVRISRKGRDWIKTRAAQNGVCPSVQHRWMLAFARRHAPADWTPASTWTPTAGAVR